MDQVSMKPSQMPSLVAVQLGQCAESGLRSDKDFAGGYRIIEAAFHRDRRGKKCYWLAKVRTPKGGFNVSFDSTGVREKIPVAYL